MVLVYPLGYQKLPPGRPSRDRLITTFVQPSARGARHAQGRMWSRDTISFASADQTYFNLHADLITHTETLSLANGGLDRHHVGAVLRYQ